MGGRVKGHLLASDVKLHAVEKLLLLGRDRPLRLHTQPPAFNHSTIQPNTKQSKQAKQ